MLGIAAWVLWPIAENWWAETAARYGPVFRAHRTAPELVESLGSTSGPARVRAMEALIELGPPAVPALLDALGHEDPIIRRDAASILGRMAPSPDMVAPKLAGLLDDPDRQVRLAAIDTLGRLQWSNADGVPLIRSAFENEDSAVQDCAIEILARFGRWGVPALAELLEVSTGPRRRHIASLLEGIGPDAEEAVPALTRALGGPDDGVGDITGALAGIGPAAIPALVDALRSDDSRVRRSAAVALTGLDAITAEALQALGAAVRDPDEDVRYAAVSAFRVIVGRLPPDADTRSTVVALAEALGDDSERVRSAAVQAIAFAPIDAAPAVPALIDMLGGTTVDDRWLAALALGRIGSAAADALPALRRVVEDETGTLRVYAAYALLRIEAGYLDGMPILISALRDENSSLQTRAIWLLGELGRRAEPAVPALVELLESNRRDEVRAAVLEALKQIDPAAYESARERFGTAPSFAIPSRAR